MLADFQICICVPLICIFITIVDVIKDGLYKSYSEGNLKRFVFSVFDDNLIFFLCIYKG